MKMAIVLSILVLMMAGIAACTSPVMTTAPSAPSPVSTATNGLTPTPGAHAISSGVVYFEEIPDIISQPGSSVEIQLTFTNYDTAARIMNQFPPLISLESRNLPFENRIVRSFPAGEEQVQLQSGESKKYRVIWDQKNNSGQAVPYGWYSVRITVNSQKITDPKSNQGAGGEATRVLVLPSGGVRVKDIAVNQSQTANGVTLNLEKIELQIEGARLYTLSRPDNYNPKDSLAFETAAEYRVDAEDWKPAAKTEFGSFILEGGIRHIWDLDPIPQNARELSFRINRTGDRQGPWEFKLPLQ